MRLLTARILALVDPDATDRASVELAPPARRAAEAVAGASIRAPGAGWLAALHGAAGNRGTARALARWAEGDGIGADGVVHPDVQAAIAAARGAGRPLEHRSASRLGDAYGDSLGDVRVHADGRADALAGAVAARAFTVGRDIFFAAGEYRPGTPSGDELLAHEVAHVVQQRGAPDTGPLQVSQPGDALERDAEAAARAAGY
jgi:hypothetical protein